MKWVLLISVLLMGDFVSAIIVADYATATNPPSGDWNIDWDYVYKYKNCSSVAVGSHWLLTAAHVAHSGGSENVVVNGTNYNQREIIFHSASEDLNHTKKADLALVRFDKVFPGHYPLYAGDFPRLNAVMIGFGMTGMVYNTYYTDSGTGLGVKRWGSQKIDEAYNDIELGSTYNDGFVMNFSLSDTPYEAGVGSHDSGSGTFVKEEGVWKLAGINVARSGGSEGWINTIAVSLPAYRTWATNAINEMGDLDGDGIPNYWEQQFGSTTGVIASSDQDGDGPTGWQEYVADTDPIDNMSFFQIDAFSTKSIVYFIGSTNRQYRLFCTTNDLTNIALSWSPAHSNWLWGTGTNSCITVTNTNEKAFYRLQVTLP